MSAAESPELTNKQAAPAVLPQGRFLWLQGQNGIDCAQVARAFAKEAGTHIIDTTGRNVMSVIATRLAIASTALALLAASSSGALAQKKYDIGATDTEIKIGNIMPYSGPASAYGVIGRTEAAYFNKINAAGGINGRKINFVSYDDSYSPPKAVEQARKLVESDEVLFIFNSLGTPSNSAIQKYMNSKKVPQLFVATGATKWNDPKNFPWTMGWQPSYQSETQIYAKYLLKEKPDAKIAVLYQNDDYGKDYLKGLKDGLGAKAASMIIAEESFETTEPTVDSHIVKLKASGADVFVDIATPKFAAQAIKKVAEIEWKPLHFLNNVSASVGSVIKPAGMQNAQEIISAAYLKDASDPQWNNDPGMKDFYAFLAKDFPEGDKLDQGTVVGYGAAQTLVQVLKQCGDDLTRENIMKQAANLKGFRTEVMLPGIKIDTSATDFAPISSLQLMRFKGERWNLFGDVISADVAG
jgi:ABC-type branched-subunit amino acid transport system substrate-binding protein